MTKEQQIKQWIEKDKERLAWKLTDDRVLVAAMLKIILTIDRRELNKPEMAIVREIVNSVMQKVLK